MKPVGEADDLHILSARVPGDSGSGLGFRVQGAGCRVQGSGFTVGPGGHSPVGWVSYG